MTVGANSTVQYSVRVYVWFKDLVSVNKTWILNMPFHPKVTGFTFLYGDLDYFWDSVALPNIGIFFGTFLKVIILIRQAFSIWWI